MGLRHLVEFFGSLGESHVEYRFAPAFSFEQELQSKRGFSRAGVALNHIDTVFRKAAAEDIVQAYDAGRCFIFFAFRGLACFPRHWFCSLVRLCSRN